jgi:hypothetical protein
MKAENGKDVLVIVAGLVERNELANFLCGYFHVSTIVETSK